MATTNFETRALASANKLINKYGQYSIYLTRSKSLIDSNKPWLGEIKSYTPTVVKMVKKTIDRNVVNISNQRLDNINSEFLIAGDQLTNINTDDMVMVPNIGIDQDFTLSSSTITSDIILSAIGYYNIDSSGGDIVITLDSGFIVGDILIFSRISNDQNTVTITPTPSDTIDGDNTYQFLYNNDTIGFI